MKKRSNDLVKDILDSGAADKKDSNRLPLLAAKALRDFQPAKRDEAVVALARDKMFLLIESEAGLNERFLAGELLGALGDSRLETENFLLVKGGEFIRGSKDWERSQPVRRIYLADFWTGKYPVTNQEFKRFVEAGGYQTQDWWSPEGWQWRETEPIIEPLYWHDRKWNGPNFPVVGVSWYEAEAYAKWLSAKMGHTYRLPSEAEWEKAARGPEGFRYPWGNEWQSDYCNSGESQLGRTSPVGIFPHGKSPYGCMDMAGNVWEWCADWYDEEYYQQSPAQNPSGSASGKYRVLRGGSWVDGAGGLRSSDRLRFLPGVRFGSLGFRVVSIARTH